MNILRHIDPADGVAVLTFDRPGSSANVLDEAVLRELDEHLAVLEATPGLRGVLLRGAKPTIFIAGADLHALAEGGLSPARLAPVIDLGHAVFERLARLPVPSVAAIHGACLGGGLELALACDWRAASDSAATKLGLPETGLGILPAWGGCVRLPPLIGLPAALSLIVSGRRLAAAQAARAGLVDAVAHEEYLEAAARRLLARGKRPAPRRRLVHLAPLRAFVALRARVAVAARTHGHYPAPPRAVEVCVAALGKSHEAGFALEKAALLELAATSAARHLMGIFLGRERIKKSVADPRPAPPRVAAVVGAGVMGAGIAWWLAAHRVPVRLQDVSPEALGRGLETIRRLAAEAVRHRALTPVEGRAALDRIIPIDADTPLRGVDWVIEAAAEKLDVKRAIFRRLEARVAPDAILATNTSALSIDAIADGLAHPGRVVGLHFFNPVHRMPLVEIVRGPRTAAAAVDSARRLVLALDKLPVVARDRPGFLVNRVLIPGLVEAVHLFREGVPVAEIDRALEDFGLPMGPLRLADEVGLDIASHVARDLAERLPHLAAPGDTLERLIAHGWLGKKSGRGFYTHPTRGKAKPNPGLRALRLAPENPASRAAAPDRAEIVDCVVLVMVNEAARCLDEGVVDDADDLDLAMVLGTGWAPFRGGPLHHADALGAAPLVARLDALAAGGRPHLEPCAALRARAAQGRTFFPASPKTP